MRSLPYPGHTWSFSQHAVGLNPKTLYDFLKCAAPFEGHIRGYDRKITELMIATDVLTINRRDGKADAWRDYQQILAELGLIYSTKIVRALTLTELGQMFLAGDIGFSELIGVQALRYQYPNGQKSTIQSRLRNELRTGSTYSATTLTELQTNLGILLKPGALILRVLLELERTGLKSELSIAECQAFLLPCRTNQDWVESFIEIKNNRSLPTNIKNLNIHSKRNFQDWFKFLGKSDFFETDGKTYIALSEYSINNSILMDSYCTKEESITSFWVPTGFEIKDRCEWFDWFGHLPYEAQEALRMDLTNNPDYISKNYVGGLDEEDDDITSVEPTFVNLQPVDLNHLGRDTSLNLIQNIEILAQNLINGAQKRHAKTLLHDRIIKNLAENFISQGAKVESDPNSVDLFSTWPDGNSAIFEVKTVTRRSLQGRLRSAIGQVEEYSYRRYISGAGPSDKVIVVNTELNSSAWQTNFLAQHLGIGLICTSPRDYRAFAPESSKTKVYWKS